MNVVPIAPHSLLGRVKAETIGGMILRRLLAYHPKPVSRRDLMEGAGLHPYRQGPICAYTSFHWHVERANDDLAEFGWKIVKVGSDETYALGRT